MGEFHTHTLRHLWADALGFGRAIPHRDEVLAGLASAGGLRASEMVPLLVGEVPPGRRDSLATRVARRRATMLEGMRASLVAASPLVAAALAPGEITAAVEASCLPAFAFGARRTGWNAWRVPRRPALKGANVKRDPVGERDREWRGLFRRGGVVVRAASDPRGGVGLKVIDNGLEIGLDLGGARIFTCCGAVRVVHPGAIPETVAIAAVGRELDAMVSHPLFAGRGYRIVDVSSDLRSVSITAATGVVPLPWADGR